MCALQVAANKQSSGYKEDSAAHVDGSPEKALDTQIDPGSDPRSDSKEIVSTILLAQQAREQEVKSSVQQLQARISALPGTTSAGLLSAPKDLKDAEDNFVLGTFTAQQFRNCIAEGNAKVDKQSGKADEKAAAPEAPQESQAFILQNTMDSPVANVPAALTPLKQPTPLFSPVGAAAIQTPQSTKSVSVQYNEEKARMERQVLIELASELLVPNQPIAKPSAKDDETTQAVRWPLELKMRKTKPKRWPDCMLLPMRWGKID